MKNGDLPPTNRESSDNQVLTINFAVQQIVKLHLHVFVELGN